MAGSINKVILIGNLGKDPEVRHLESGVAVCNFSIATGETYKDRNSGEKITHTEWHNIVLWRGLAEVAEKYLKKGAKIYINQLLYTGSSCHHIFDACGCYNCVSASCSYSSLFPY